MNNYEFVIVEIKDRVGIIEFNYLPSMAQANGKLSDTVLPIPHAWKSGNQIANLKAQINRMPNTNGTYVLCIPKKPYRCPPGPYERACVGSRYSEASQRRRESDHFRC